jgi:hypothetical protein
LSFLFAEMKNVAAPRYGARCWAMLAFQDYVRSAGRRHRSNAELIISQSRRDDGEPASQPVTMKDPATYKDQPTRGLV